MRTRAGHRKTCHRYDVPGHAHYLTFSCFRGQPFLLGELAPRWLAEAIDEARAKVPLHLWAFVFMPEHVHLLIQPASDSTISRILSAIKGPVGRRAVAHVRAVRPGFLARLEDAQPNGARAYRFWQRGGGYDRNICGELELMEKVNYIHLNPVRRGLVDGAEDWHWSSYRAWRDGSDEPLRIDRGPLRRG